MVGLSKCNLTHDLVLESGLFTMHTLAADPDDQLEKSLAIIQGLAGRSGRDGDKVGRFATKTGVTGAPILLDAMSYVEGRVVASMDVQENTVFVADVVAAERFRPGAKLDVGTAWTRLPKEWVETYERNHEEQVDDARIRRGLPVPVRGSHG
jgi:flavin reductase (DIM6/NTAB) family NADH-FMN oxidoreductase RutF